MPTGIENRQAAFSWLSTFLKDKGYQFSRSGFKGGTSIGNHAVDEATGFWANPNYSSTKPPRWLFHIDVTDMPATAHVPDLEEIGIGSSNTAQGDKAGLAVRILPLIKTGEGEYHRVDDFEANAIFVFHGPLSGKSSADAFSYVPNDGVVLRSGNGARGPEDYIFAALIGLRPRTDEMEFQVNGNARNLTYGEMMDALSARVVAHPKDGQAGPMEVYDLSVDDEAGRLTTDIEAAWDAIGPPPAIATAGIAGKENDEVEAIDFADIQIPENPYLLGIEPAVYRQINAALKSGKEHIMLYGPPGTGKTSLARWVAGSLPGGKWTLVTGSSDWSSQDIVGGYQPVGNGEVHFVPGVLLKAFDQPLIIDELNRCDIDKVIGPLFTVLSGQQTTLPYRLDIEDTNSPAYTILPKPKADPAEHEFAPGPAWRLIATINSIDKASLYQMSYALSRRFGWVYVDVPTDLRAFILAYLQKVDAGLAVAAGDTCPLATVWGAINSVRAIGPAPIIDMVQAIKVLAPDSSFFGAPDAPMKSALLDAMDMALLPMLDGIVLQDAKELSEAFTEAFGLEGAERKRAESRLEAVAI